MKIRSTTIVLDDGTTQYHVGNIDVTISNAEIFYRPSQNNIVEHGKYDYKKEKTLSMDGSFILDHVSFHKDGRVHAVAKSGEKILIQSADKRLSLDDTGNIDLFSDVCSKIPTLPKEFNPRDGVLALPIKSKDGNIFVRFDLIAGSNLVKKQFNLFPIEDKYGKLIYQIAIAIGKGKGAYADRILLISLFSNKGIKTETGRMIFFPEVKGLKKLL